MLGLTIFRSKVRIKVLYKSGNSHEAWFTTFTKDRNTWSWETVTQSNSPVIMGVDDIEAVWQVNARINVFTAIGQVLKIV